MAATASCRRIILHWDYDCFYAQVFEARDARLRKLPLAVQQKQIIVTCNYLARERGLHKLHLISDAKKICPDLVIVLGEDLTPFRDASKELYNFIRSFSWNGRAERLGLDEVFLDVTDLVDYNVELLNSNNLADSFFCLSKQDPSDGFPFDATRLAGHAFGSSMENGDLLLMDRNVERLRLHLGSHLAQHIRTKLEELKGYTSAVGVSTSKLLSKLVGNVNKPRGQTSLMPPYVANGERPSNVTLFMDDHEIGKIPGIGFKTAHKLREYVLQHPVEVRDWVTAETVSVRQLRTTPGVSAALLDTILAGPGSPLHLGFTVWSLIHGIDDTEVAPARQIPRQISIEDSYTRLTTLEDAIEKMAKLTCSLIRRMRTDLVEQDEPDSPGDRWLALPRTLRLSTKPRLPLNPDGSRPRTSTRISRTAPVPSFMYNLTDNIDALADRLVAGHLLPMFRKIHSARSGWNLSLINVAVTNIVETAGEDKSAAGRDISKMFQFQETNLKEWKVEDRDVPPDGVEDQDELPRQRQSTTSQIGAVKGSEDVPPLSQEARSSQNEWQSDGGDSDHQELSVCPRCGAHMPPFAMSAHERFHDSGNGQYSDT